MEHKSEDLVHLFAVVAAVGDLDDQTHGYCEILDLRLR